MLACIRCGCATTTIGGVMDWAKRRAREQGRGKANKDRTLHHAAHNYVASYSTGPNKHRLVNHDVRLATLLYVRHRFVITAFILRKVQTIVVNAVLLATEIREPACAAQPSVNVRRDIVPAGTARDVACSVRFSASKR